ncbi:N-acyl homoserine lactonase family protein [Teredinibacter sp. KSP-S5-2]|uniref:N-acyl homoserine lactonase family protein n=1 Tax=Teredinibacter sp. KSP-S5-2 TaxID=3034506 RepID=UPI002934BBB3|nr:N-acyl homoserine lactonase family protein [Teredinibacter sp. KSP-S5-2]WNO08631.1 N-acyl homoserine lactonase family protein [Teredinibacter sp. KSP-S5-2]
MARFTLFRQIHTLLATMLLVLISHASFANEPALSVQLFDCGTILARDASIFNPNMKKNTPKLMANTCYLVKHPKGVLLWDTGLNDQIANQVDGIEAFDGAIHLTLNTPLQIQLANAEITPDDVAYIAMSHLHMDHTGNANLFANAKWLVQSTEHQIAVSKQAANYGFTPQDYQNLKQVKLLAGDYDVFGDGRVKIISTPGHSPGHQSLFLDLKHYGPVLLSGDLYHFERNRLEKAVPIFNNVEESQKSFTKIDQFLEATGSALWIQHDYEQFHLLMMGGSGKNKGVYF